MMIRSNALQQTGKQCSSFSSVVLVCVSNSELPLEYCYIIFQWLGFIRIEQCFTLGLEIEIISFLLFTHGVRISLTHSPYWEEKNCKGVGYGTDLLELFIFKSCGLLKTADLAVETRILESILARVTREPTRPLTEYNPDLNKHKRFVRKKKICHEQKVLSREKKFMDKKLWLEFH